MPKKTVEVKEIPKETKNSVTVEFRGMTREYSKDAHGADFAKLAKEFAEKVGGVVS